MTQEATNSKSSVLEAFLKQRAKRQNNTAIEAKKLVNLYRHLSLFGDEFLETYNKMLLDSSPEVQMALPEIVGGTVVRQYYDFLKARAQQNDTNGIISDEEADTAYKYRHEESYLPTPDEVQPFTFMAQTDGQSVVPVDAGAGMAQVGAFERALEKQNELLVQALEKIGQAPMSETSGGLVSSDLTAFQQAQTQMLADLLERQNAQMNANIDTILKQTQELSARQMETVEKLSQRVNAHTRDAYDIMIEDEVAPVMREKEPKQTYANRYRSENTSVYRPAEVELEPIVETPETSVSEGSVTPKRHSLLSGTDEVKENVSDSTIIPDWKG